MNDDLDQLATQKAATKVKGGENINETKRAQALLRSLAQGRDRRTTSRGDVIRTRPAIGRSVVTSELPSKNRPKYDISFFNNNQTGVDDNPFRGGLKDSKSKGLQYMLGTTFKEDIPNNSTIKIDATDGRRVSAYERGTKGAIKFEPYPWMNSTKDGGTSSTYVNKAGNFQPRVDNKFTAAKPNPGDALRQLLINAARAVPDVVRNIKPATRVTRYDPLAAIQTGADIGTWMRDNLDVNSQVSGRGGGRKALND